MEGPDRSEVIIGLDRPAGGERKRPLWRKLAIGLIVAFVAFGLIAALVDALTTTEEERVASTFTDFADALSAGDGERACSLITDQSRIDEIMVARYASGQPGAADADPSCPRALTGDLQRAGALGADLGDLGDIDASKVEDAVEVDGDSATISTENGLTISELRFQKDLGRWLVDLVGSDVRVGDVPVDVSDEELMGAADSLCRNAFSRSDIAISFVVLSSRVSRTGSLGRAARDWQASEQRLADDLGRLNASAASSEIDALAAAISTEAGRIGELASDPDGTGRLSAILKASREVIRVATEQGFATFGCAAPVGRG